MASSQIAFQPGSYSRCADFHAVIAHHGHSLGISKHLDRVSGWWGKPLVLPLRSVQRRDCAGICNRERYRQPQPNMNPCAVGCGNHVSWDIRDAQLAPWWPFTARHSGIYSCDSLEHVKKLWLPCKNIHHTEPTLTIFYLWKQFLSFFPRHGGATGINHAIRGLFLNATRKTLSQINLQMEEARLQKLRWKCQK